MMPAGLLVNAEVLDKLNLDATLLEDEQAEQNESLTVLWRTLEFLPLPHPKKTDNGWVEGRRIYRGQGWLEIPDTFDAHESLQRRKAAVKNVNWKSSLTNITYRH